MSMGDGGLGVTFDMRSQEDFFASEGVLVIATLAAVGLWLASHMALNGLQSGRYFHDHAAFDLFHQRNRTNVVSIKRRLPLFFLQFPSLQEEQRFILTSNGSLLIRSRIAFFIVVPFVLYDLTDSHLFETTMFAPVYRFFLLLSCFVLLCITYRKNPRIKLHLEHFCVIGLACQVLLMSWMNMWSAVALCHWGVTVNDSRHRLNFFIMMLMAFLCVFTTIRFKVLFLFAILLYVLVTVVSVYHCACRCTRAGWIEEMVGNLSFVAVIVFCLVAKRGREAERRASWQKSYQAFKVTKALSTEEDQKEGRTMMDKSVHALSKVLKTLDYVAAVPAISETGLDQKIARARKAAEFVMRSLERTGRLLEESAEDALKELGKNYENRDDLIQFMRTNVTPTFNHRKTIRSTTTGDLGNTPTFKSLSTLKSLKIAPPASPRVSEPVDIVLAEDSIASMIGERYDFNAYALGRETNGVAMIYAAEVAVVHSGSAEEIGLDLNRFRAWVRSLHSRYLPVAYHNEAHAAQVTHAALYFAQQTRWFNTAESCAVMGLLIAALGHDVGHIGCNNLFCVKTENKPSLIWNEASVLENMSAATTLACMRGEANIIEGLHPLAWTSLRAYILRFILATDIKEHISSTKRIRTWIDNYVVQHTESNFTDESQTAADDDAEADGIIGELFIKAADVGHGLLEWPAHRECAYRVLCEFYEQGDKERELSLPISPLCDRRNAGNIAGSQAFFIDFFSSSLIKLIGSIPHIVTDGKIDQNELLRNAEDNKEQWRAEEKRLDLPSASTRKLPALFGRASDKAIFPYEYEQAKLKAAKILSTEENLLSLVREEN